MVPSIIKGMKNNSSLENFSDVVDVDRSILKISIVIFAGVIFAFSSGYLVSTSELLYASISTIVFLIIFTLQNLFIKSFDKLFLATLLESLALALPFYRNFSGLSVIVLSVLLILLFKGSFDVRKELESTIKVRFLRSSHLSLKAGLPAIVLFFGAMLFLQGTFLTEKNFNDLLLSPLTPLVRTLIPAFSPSIATDKFLNNIAISNLTEADLKDFNELTPSAQNQLTAGAVSQLKEKIEEYIDREVDLKKSVSANIYDILNYGYAGLAENRRLIVSMVLALSLYLFVKSLIPFLYLPIAFLCFIVYEILLASNFFVVQLESRSREILILK